MDSNTPLITVAIPTYRREEVLIDTIHDVLGQSFKNLELIVVDQSTNHKRQTINALKSINDPRFRYFRTTPPAVTVARNFALEQAKSPYIIFLDDDVRLDNNLVKVYYKTFQEKPELTAIAGKVMQKGFKTLPLLHFDEYGITHGGYTAKKPGYTNAFPGGNCAMRVKEALSLGGFDTRYYGNAFREENDLSLRMAKRGYLIYYQPKAYLLHLAAPYGGNRVQTHIYDDYGFYKNELFFTLRMVERKYLKRALKLKFAEYCLIHEGGSKTREKYFKKALRAARWRILFGKQRKAKVVHENWD